MPHVVTENCVRCRFTECVAVCPVECFHANDEQLFIDPDACIDCGACIPTCPVQAIYEDISVPEEYAQWVAINAERSSQLPLLVGPQTPLPTAEARRAELGF